MAKRVFVLLLCAFFLFCSSCAGTQAPQPSTTQPATTTVPSPMLNPYSEAELLEVLRPLVEKNFQCVEELLYWNSLPPDWDDPVAGTDTAYYVNDERFASFADFKQFLSEIYIEAAVDELLYNRPMGQMHPLYFEQDGRLCVNQSLARSTELLHRLEVREIQLEFSSDQGCSFVVATNNEHIAMNAVKENNAWLLDAVYTEALEEITYTQLTEE